FPVVALSRLSSGSVKLNAGDWKRKFCAIWGIGKPSIVALTDSPSCPAVAHLRNPTIVLPKMGSEQPLLKDSSTFESSPFRIGKKSIFPAGTVQLRTSLFETNEPPRNHTGPD